MYRYIFTLLFSTIILTVAVAQPKQEVRAAWITAVYGLDWPKTKATSPTAIKKQKDELIDILDKLKAANFNTILFQTRTRGDVLYRSNIEPFNSILTGKIGEDPGYDPLTFAIDECHKRGMECHAWMVTIPLGNKKHVASLGFRSVTKREPQICVPYKTEYFLNPANPATKDYLMKLVSEVISRYDVDGVHFDYLRYPENAPMFPDKREYMLYSNGRSISQFRRDNLTDIVRHIYKGVKAVKPWVKVSTCPIGKYRDTSRYTSHGFNAYNTVFQDPQGWLNEGIQDQIYPMMYFKGNSFYPFALDWQEQSNGRQIIPGLGIYFLDPSEGKWTRDEIDRQILFTRKHHMAGQAHYRAKHVMNNIQELYSELKNNFYAYPALQPPMPWLDSVVPSAPSNLKTTFTKEGYTELTWKEASDNDKQNKPMYVIYGSDSYPVDTAKPENIIAANVRESNFIYAPALPWLNKRFFAVTAIDRFGNEGQAVQYQP